MDPKITADWASRKVGTEKLDLCIRLIVAIEVVALDVNTEDIRNRVSCSEP